MSVDLYTNDRPAKGALEITMSARAQERSLAMMVAEHQAQRSNTKKTINKGSKSLLASILTSLRFG